MNKLTTYGKTMSIAVLTGATLALVPASAGARPLPAEYRQPVEFAMPAPPRVQLLPPVSRGTTVILPAHPELDRFEKELAGA